MFAKKDGVSIHFNPENVTKFINGGYLIYDDNGNLLDNPEYYAQCEAEKNVHTATMPDFMKWLSDNGYTVTKA